MIRSHAGSLALLALMLYPASALAADDPAASPREGPKVLKASQYGVGAMIADVAFTDIDGKAGRLSDYRGRGATVFCMTGAGCPLAKKYGPTLADLEKRYRARGVSFVLVNPYANESPDGTRAAVAGLRGLGFGGRYVADGKGELARALAATSSTEAFVVDAARTLVYRGAIDDQYGLGYSLPAARRRFLIDAIEAALAGRAVAVGATTAPGCVLELGNKAGTAVSGKDAAAVTYHGRISRLVQRNCTECHRRGESAPFALGTYADLKDHLAMVRKVVRQGVMPPWFADAETGHWANDRSLAERDRADLLKWIEIGAPEGDPKDAPLPRTFADGWQLGKPDAIFEVAKPIDVPARGPIPYRHAVIETRLDRDRWVKSVEVRTTTPQVVHHLLVFLAIPQEHARTKEQPDYKGGLNGYFAALVPNQGATPFPEGTAKFLPKGARLILQIHYTPSGTAAKDTPRIGVTFADGPPAHEVVTLAAANRRFLIPPGAANHEVRAAYRFRGPTRLLSFLPHSHLRGKAFRYVLEFPDGRTRAVLDVPRYDFNWQLEYHLRDPIDVPAGTILRATAWYDNSGENPANPDPAQTVRFGEQTSDEMMICYFTGHSIPEGRDTRE